MAKSLIGLLILVPLLAVSICEAAKGFHPISDSHRSAALELFVSTDGSFGSLEETYEAFRSFEILGIDKGTDVNVATCKSVSEVLVASAVLKDLFYALRVNSIIKCGISKEIYEGLISRLKAALVDARSLHDYYYAIGSMRLIKDQSSEVDILLGDADAIFQSIKALSQSDGRWRFSSSNPESSTYAAGLALEALAGVISLSSTDIDQNLIGTLKNDILKLFDSIEKYDDGAFYFDDKIVEPNKDQGPLTTTSSVIRGLATVSAVNLGSLNLPGDQIMGLAKFFLGIGIPGDTKDFFNQLDSLAFFENNRFTIPLIMYLPASVLSLSKKDQLKVRVSTVLGSEPPSLSVKLVRAIKSGSKDSPIIENQELKFDSGSGDHLFEALSENFDVGHYLFTFESILHDSANKAIYTMGGLRQVPIIVTGDIEIDNAETAIFDSDLGNIEIQKKLELIGESTVSLSANHLQKMRLSFQLATPHGHIFRPHQAFLKLSHESGTEHVFVVGSSGKEFEIILDFLGLVEKFFYLSGRYGIQLTVGDSVMENSFLRNIGYIDLDLPEAPENAPRPPPQPVDPYSRYGPKAEISHIFRTPDKRPPKELSLVFVGLTLLPFIGFLVGLMCLGVNLKNFPTSPAPATFAFLFECGVGAVLLLYVFFWLKLDLFTTLRILGVLGILLIFVGHQILSHLASASASAKVKSA